MTSEEEKAVAAAAGAGGSGKERLLSKIRAKEEAHASLVKTNSETFRLSNDGRFPVKISLAFEEQPQVEPCSRSTTPCVVTETNRGVKLVVNRRRLFGTGFKQDITNFLHRCIWVWRFSRRYGKLGLSTHVS